MQAVIDYLKTNQDRFVAELGDYLRFASVSAQSQHKPDLAACADWLVGQGAIRVTSAALDYIFTDKNPLFERLSAKLPRA